MPNKDYALTMSRYNMWQNESLIAAASELSKEERERDRGAFFGSIQRTLSHVLWGDMMWMGRFAGTPMPDASIEQSPNFIATWEQYLVDRPAFDERILKWAHEVEPEWFEGDLTWYSGAIGREMSKPKRPLVVHFFNHQTHHRGQVHAMLTAAGAKPDDTDIPFMPERFLAM